MSRFIKYSILLVIVSFYSCSPSQYCKKSRKYIKKVDTSKPFLINGKYCTSNISKRQNEGCRVKFYIYDGVSGKPLDGLLFVAGPTSKKIEFSAGQIEIEVSAGDYHVEIAATGSNSQYSLPFAIKGLEFIDYNFIEINCYVGGSLQF